MTPLTLHGREVQSAFALLGDNENDMTFSMGWALARCPQFLKALVAKVAPAAQINQPWRLNLQDHAEDNGYTDIEIIGGDCHIIIEAKRHWQLPDRSQLQRYASRFRSSVANELFMVISERSAASARHSLPLEVANRPVIYCPWHEVRHWAKCATDKGKNNEKRLLREFVTYLEGLLKMRNSDSNLVYVVPLAAGTPDWSNLSWIDIVEKAHQYFHPLDKPGYPRVPPNYFGFRYAGRLQSIYHVDSYLDNEDISLFVKGIKGPEWRSQKAGPYYIYQLGNRIEPSKVIRSGQIWNQPMAVAIDLLLTAESVDQARTLTIERRNKEMSA